MTDMRSFYDAQANNWARREPNSLSDFTARPVIFEMCGSISGLEVIDLGAGEGYCSREMKARGAASVVGVEISSEMVAQARAQEEAGNRLGIEYMVGDITDIPAEDARYDLALAVFVFNYLSMEQSRKALHEIHRVLKPGGRLVVSFPHPCFPFMRAPERPFFFDYSGRGYFSGRDAMNEGRIFCRDGKELQVRVFHKTFEDILSLLTDAGFFKNFVLRELGVLEEHLRLDPNFFGPLRDIPLHVAIRVEK